MGMPAWISPILSGDAGKSILIMNVHPSVGENPRGPTTTTQPFAPEALYELKIAVQFKGGLKWLRSNLLQTKPKFPAIASRSC
jgi:hypothetical protein